MELDYQAYETLFNTGDDEALIARFFAAATRMVSANGTREGAGELLAFLKWAHDGVREVMRPQTVMSRDGLLFAEVDMDFHATKHRPDFPFGEMHPGDLITVKFFVTYRLDGEGRLLDHRASSSARSSTTRSAPCSRSSAAWFARSTPTTNPNLPARPAATPASASS